MKTLLADLTTDVVGSYDQTKTTIQGRVASKTIDGETVLGPPLSKFIDFATDSSGSAPLGSFFVSPNGRIFVLSAASAGLATLHLYDFNFTTGTHAYVGRINFVLPNTAATTMTVRGLRVHNDSTDTGWRIVLATTGSVLINGGVFIVNSINKTDFVLVSPPTIAFATGNDQKAVYFTQLGSAMGSLQAETSLNGLVYDSNTSTVYAHNGVSATHQYYVRDLTAALSYSTQTFTITIASPGVVTATAHGYSVNDPVVLSTTGALPTGLTAGTVYFVRNPTANTFELSATTGGASINTTGTQSGIHSVGRAFGTTSSTVSFKTGNLPALTGTLLSVDSERKAIPTNSPINGGVLNGNACAFFSTTTNLYLGLLSELTNGATTWPSLSTSNVLGAVNQITTPTPVFANWSSTLDAAQYVTNTSKIIIKQLQNNQLITQVGELNNQYYETYSLDTINLGFVTVINIYSENGWFFVAGGTTGQRGIGCFDFRSDSYYDYSYIVTKVLDTPNSQIRALCSFEKLFEQTGNVKLQYRTSGFGSITGGWTDLDEGQDLANIVTYDEIQFKILFNMQSEGSSSPAQVYELLLSLDANEETSDHWEYSYNHSSSGSPTRVGFRLKKAYTSSVPTLYFRAYDLSDSLLTNHNTSAHSSYFEYSTDGLVWNPLGTIPNTVGTLVRYTFASPPGVDVRPGLKES
jgi:hypothetical protein